MPKTLADGALARPLPTRQFLVDDNDGQTSGACRARRMAGRPATGSRIASK